MRHSSSNSVEVYSMLNLVKTLARDEEGAAMVEYAILLGLIAIVSIGIITTLGQTVSKVFNTVNTSVTNA